VWPPYASLSARSDLYARNRAALSLAGTLRILREIADGGNCEAVHDYSLTAVPHGARNFVRRVAGSLGEAAQKLNPINRRVRAKTDMEDRPLVVRAALKEFLLHGAKYAFPATLGSPTRGIPTAYAAPPLVTLVSQPNELPPVWPDAEGKQRGVTFHPRAL
jgi:hypothetical protein